MLTAMKKAEDSDALILRFYEWAGKSGEVRISVPAGAAGATLTNLMEQPEGSPLTVTANKSPCRLRPTKFSRCAWIIRSATNRISAGAGGDWPRIAAVKYKLRR